MNEILRKYVRGVLNEGKYDSFVSVITRSLLQLIKTNAGDSVNLELSYQWPYDDIHSGREFVVVLALKRDVSKRAIEYDVAVGGEGGTLSDGRPGIVVSVDITVPHTGGLEETVYQKLWGELKDTVTHELEHVLQKELRLGQRPERQIVKTRSTYQYLIKPHEIEAYVTGFYAKAKAHRVPLVTVIDDFIQKLQSAQYINRKQAADVRQRWLDFAHAKFPQAQLGEGLVLAEGKYDSFVRQLSQQALAKIKSATGSFTERWDIVWPFPGEFEGRKLTVNLEYTVDIADEHDMYIEAAAGQYRTFSGLTPFITVIVDVNTNRDIDGVPDIRFMLYHINMNIQSSIAHELEHVLQFTFQNPVSGRPGPDDRPEYDADDHEQTFEYLTDPTEVAAHVRGFYLMAKRRRIPLGRIMKQAISQHEAMGHISRLEGAQVFALWRKWAKSNLPSADLNTTSSASPAHHGVQSTI